MMDIRVWSEEDIFCESIAAVVEFRSSMRLSRGTWVEQMVAIKDEIKFEFEEEG